MLDHSMLELDCIRPGLHYDLWSPMRLMRATLQHEHIYCMLPCEIEHMLNRD